MKKSLLYYSAFLIFLTGCSTSNSISQKKPESTADHINEILSLDAEVNSEPLETYLGLDNS